MARYPQNHQARDSYAVEPCAYRNESCVQQSNKQMDRERLLSYDIQRYNNEEEDGNRGKLKRQLTNVSLIEERDLQESSEGSPWTVKHKGPRRKQQRTDGRERSDGDVGSLERDERTNTASNGGRIFLNSKNRMNSRQYNVSNESYQTERHPYATGRENTVNLGNMNEQVESADLRRNSRGKDMNMENESAEPFPISTHALHYAVEHHLPPIRIEKNFRCKNARYAHPIAFDYWCIDKYGKLACYTRRTELYVCLCDPRNYPSSAANVEIVPLQPNHPPFQHSLILKFISNCITQEELKMKLESHVNSLFKVENMRGSETIKCHRWQLSHFSTDYKCPFLIEYRRTLLRKLKENPNLLPANTRIFIPFDCHDNGNTRNMFLTNPTERNGNMRAKNEEHVPAGDNDSHGWSSLVTEPCRRNIGSKQSNMWQDLKNKQNEIDQMKEALAARLKEHADDYHEHMNEIHMILMSFLIFWKARTTKKDILPILTSTPMIIQRIAENSAKPSKSKEENEETQKLRQHTWLALECLKDRSEIRAANQRTIDDAMEEPRKMMIEGIESIRKTNEQ